ncbi:transposable element Tcb1 transposase [Trichonephila clavipes]|uniref:Transposable element Tcb1 transposase n=1 Tax=Trichonephila clavipes TaxID=2585209 RepID=A0A8X6UYB3_TRICX|nr:transposable element Tcb1 transposase [Trichonephila clavipes]
MLNSSVTHRHTGPAQCIMVLGGIAYHSRTPFVHIAGTLKSQRCISEVLDPVVFPYLQGLATYFNSSQELKHNDYDKLLTFTLPFLASMVVNDGLKRQTVWVAANRHISHSFLDPNDFTVVNCIVKGHASLSLSPPSLRFRLCSRFTLLATYTYFDPKDFSPHPSTVSKIMRPFHHLLNKMQRKK